MFFRRGPKLEDVRSQMVRLIQEAMAFAHHQARRSSAQPGERSLTIFIVSIDADDLVPRARTIITAAVAKRIEESYDNAIILAGMEAIATIPTEHLDLYLSTVLATVESWLNRGQSMIRSMISSNGSDFYNQQAQVQFVAKRWPEAERMAHKALEYDRLIRGIHSGLVVTPINIGHTLYYQERYVEAQQYYHQGLDVFAQLSPNAIAYAAAQRMVDQATQALQDIENYRLKP